jgi:hypothetical protein
MSSSAAWSEGESSCLVLVMHEVVERPRAGVRSLWGRYVAWPTFHKGRKALEDLTPEEAGNFETSFKGSGCASQGSGWTGHG